MNTPVMIAGLEKSGKTTFICAVARLAKQKNMDIAGFKPFDIGLLDINAKEARSDGELICQNMEGNPSQTLVSPYMAHEIYPFEMAFRRDGIRIDWGIVAEHLQVLSQRYDQTLIELPPGLFMPLNEKKMVFDWVKETGNSLIWLLQPQVDQFHRNLAEINHLKNLGIRFHLVINNTVQIFDQDLLFYVWDKIEKFTDQEVVGMIPYVKGLTEDFEKIGHEIDRNISGLIKTVLNIE